MAVNVTFGYMSGRTLTYVGYTETGTPHTGSPPGTPVNLPEVGTTGFYTASDENIVQYDCIVVTDSIIGVVGFGQYQPEVSTPFAATTTDMTTVLSDLSSLSSGVTNLQTTLDGTRNDLNITQFNYDDRPKAEQTTSNIALKQI